MMNTNGSVLYLCKPSGIIIGTMSGLDENSVRLRQQINTPWELSFTVSRYQYQDQSGFIQTSNYNSISEMMELLLVLNSGEKIRFQINSTPVVNNDGMKETKTVTANSIETELQDKMLKEFQVNTGMAISQENLVQGDINMNPVSPTDTVTERYNFNFDPYEQLPIDYISVNNNPINFFTKFKEDFDNGTITWNAMMDENDEGIESEAEEITFNITVDSATGEITSSNDSDVFPYYVSSMIKTYPRLSKHIRYYIDGDADSPTKDSIIAKVYYFLNVVKDDQTGNVGVFIMPKRFTVTDGQSETDPKTATTLTTPDYNNLDQYFSTWLVDIIRYYNNFGNQLSLISLALEKANVLDWTVGDVPDDIAKLYRNFSVDSQDILSFFTQTCAKSLKVVFDFDRFNKRVNVVDVSSTNSDKEHDTGVVIGLQNLLNSVSIQSPSDDGIRTKFKPTGADDLSIVYVNFGEEYMINLDYFMNASNEYGVYDKYKYVSEQLHDKYINWKNYREGEPINVSGIPVYSYLLADKSVTDGDPAEIDITYSSRREAFSDLTRRYNKAQVAIDEFNNLLPNDGTGIDYTKFTFDELCTAWTAYNNALGVLLEYYFGDYNVASFDPTDLTALHPDGTVAISIRHTMYWLDYSAYVNTIIPNVENALKIYVETDADGNWTANSKDADGNWVQVEGGNPNYNGDGTIVTENKSDAYQYDMSLYGASELDILRNAWVEAAAKLEKVGFICVEKTVDDEIVKSKDADGNYVYNTADDTGWDLLGTYEINDSKEIVDIITGTPAEGTVTAQSIFASKESFIRLLNEYLDYVSIEVRENSKTKEMSQGLIPLAVAELAICQEKIAQIEGYRDTYDALRKEISSTVSFENWSALPDVDGFTSSELVILYTLLREADYSNDNILVTNLDDISTAVSIQEELYQDAAKKLFEKSRPQYTFTATMDNLLSIPEFRAWHSSIALLNYIYLVIGIYDNETVKVRITSIESNPMIPSEEITLGFSNMVFTYDGLSDLVSLIGESMGGNVSSSSGSGSGSSGRGGTYGENEADVQISNAMLNALLRNNGYYTNLGSQVSSAKKETLKTLEDGDAIVDGVCIVDDIMSTNYDGSNRGIDNETGSILKLADGTFNFGGGGLVWDGETLKVNGDISGSTGTFEGNISGDHVIGGYITSTAKYTINNVDKPVSEMDLDHGTFSFGKEALTWDGTTLTVKGDITGSTGTVNNLIFTESIKLKSTNWYNNIYPIITASIDSNHDKRVVFGFPDDVTAPTYLAIQGGQANYCHIEGDLTTSGYFNNQSTYTHDLNGEPIRAVYVTNGGSFGYYSSTKRVKHDITENLNLEERNPFKLYDIPVVQFKYNSGSYNSTGKSQDRLGLIAEDVAEQIPEAAYYDENGIPEGWDERVILVSAVKCIQELHKEVEELKEEVLNHDRQNT